MLLSDFTVILGAFLYSFGQFFTVMQSIEVFPELDMDLLDIAVSLGFIEVTIDFYLWFAYGRFAKNSVTK